VAEVRRGRVTVSYTAGITTRVSRVELSSPPITVTASGCCTSAPAPNPSANGSSPSTVVAVVMRMGRSRRRAPA